MAKQGKGALGLPVPTDEQLEPGMVQALKRHPPLHIFRYLALVPEAFEPYMDFLAGLYKAPLDPHLRELVICRVGARAKAPYELFQHEALARAQGVTEAELAAVLAPGPVTALGEEANLLCRAVDELHDARLSPEVFEALSARYDPRMLMTWLFLIGNYGLVVRVLNGAGVPAEPVSPLVGRHEPG